MSNPCYAVRHTENPLLWEGANRIESLHNPWSAEAAPPTRFCAQHSDAGLHFRFDCGGPRPARPDLATERDRVLEGSRVELFFSASASLQRYYCLELSPWGDALLYEASHYRQMNWQWTCPLLRWESHWLEGGYRVEGLLPWAAIESMGLARSENARWWVGVFRAEFVTLPHGEKRRVWLPWCHGGGAKADFHIPEAFGQWRLEGLPAAAD